MKQKATADSTETIYFVYDGDCPICNYAAHALKISEAVGKLELVNAREQKTHPVYKEGAVPDNAVMCYRTACARAD